MKSGKTTKYDPVIVLGTKYLCGDARTGRPLDKAGNCRGVAERCMGILAGGHKGGAIFWQGRMKDLPPESL